MKTILSAIFILMQCTIFAQEYKNLDRIYYVDFQDINKDEIQIRKYLNVELNEKWWQARKNYELYRKNEDSEFLNANGAEAHKSEKVDLAKGFYLLNNQHQGFGFEINDNQQFTGNAKYQNKETDQVSDIIFKDGKIISMETVNIFNEPVKKITISDSLFTEIWYENGKITRKNTENLKLGGGQSNEIRTHYFENGNIQLEQDNISNTFKTFYENGTPKRYENGKTQERIAYDTNGRKTEHTYIADDKKCNEYYENAIIQSKKCETLDNLTTYFYHYKNGKLEDYEVLDRTKDEIRTYDKNNKLIKKNEAGKDPGISDYR